MGNMTAIARDLLSEKLVERSAATSCVSEANDILRFALTGVYKGKTAVLSSFGTESAVLLHLISKIEPATPILFLDTGKLFEETHQYRAQLARFLGLRDIRIVNPSPTDCAVHDANGTLWSENVDACCNFRKVEPLKNALNAFSAQVTGRKRFQTWMRAEMPALEFCEGYLRFNPLARWLRADLEAYFLEHELPRHPLAHKGYPSVGCQPCTGPIAKGDAYRSGRWIGCGKEECGIHHEPGQPRT